MKSTGTTGCPNAVVGSGHFFTEFSSRLASSSSSALVLPDSLLLAWVHSSLLTLGLPDSATPIDTPSRPSPVAKHQSITQDKLTCRSNGHHESIHVDNLATPTLSLVCFKRRPHAPPLPLGRIATHHCNRLPNRLHQLVARGHHLDSSQLIAPDSPFGVRYLIEIATLHHKQPKELPVRNADGASTFAELIVRPQQV